MNQEPAPLSGPTATIVLSSLVPSPSTPPAAISVSQSPDASRTSTPALVGPLPAADTVPECVLAPIAPDESAATAEIQLLDGPPVPEVSVRTRKLVVSTRWTPPPMDPMTSLPAAGS